MIDNYSILKHTELSIALFAVIIQNNPATNSARIRYEPRPRVRVTSSSRTREAPPERQITSGAYAGSFRPSFGKAPAKLRRADEYSPPFAARDEEAREIKPKLSRMHLNTLRGNRSACCFKVEDR